MEFSSITRKLTELARRASAEDGQAMVEYALLLSLIAIVGFVSVQAFGLGVTNLFSEINAGVQAGIHP
jgi:Flp pilus assembly pilin Flp